MADEIVRVILESSRVSAFFDDAKQELERARNKFPGDRVTMIALMEEVGELAKASLDEPSACVWKEAVQVAVQVAVMAARVALDGDSSVDDLRAQRGLDKVNKNHANSTVAPNLHRPAGSPE